MGKCRGGGRELRTAGDHGECGAVAAARAARARERRAVDRRRGVAAAVRSHHPGGGLRGALRAGLAAESASVRPFGERRRRRRHSRLLQRPATCSAAFVRQVRLHAAHHASSGVGARKWCTDRHRAKCSSGGEQSPQRPARALLVLDWFRRGLCRQRAARTPSLARARRRPSLSLLADATATTISPGSLHEQRPGLRRCAPSRPQTKGGPPHRRRFGSGARAGPLRHRRNS